MCTMGVSSSSCGSLETIALVGVPNIAVLVMCRDERTSITWSIFLTAFKKHMKGFWTGFCNALLFHSSHFPTMFSNALLIRISISYLSHNVFYPSQTSFHFSLKSTLSSANTFNFNRILRTRSVAKKQMNKCMAEI